MIAIAMKLLAASVAALAVAVAAFRFAVRGKQSPIEAGFAVQPPVTVCARAAWYSGTYSYVHSPLSKPDTAVPDPATASSAIFRERSSAAGSIQSPYLRLP